MLIGKEFKFIDLFAGIGGFHCAMNKYSDGKAKCVFASEINPHAQIMYKDYFKMEVFGDIRTAKQSDIKENFDVVCGGFPCQTFSKAGMQQGFGDPRGTLFREITRLIDKGESNRGEQPKILVLENVRNLITHDNGDTWRTIKKELERVGYNVLTRPVVVGPKDFGIPQLRERAIILAVRKDIYSGELNFSIPRKKSNTSDMNTVLKQRLTTEEKDKYSLKQNVIEVLDAWNAFVKGTNAGRIGFPIWSDEFGKSYDISTLPEWKQVFINKNRCFYKLHKEFLDEWLVKYDIRSFTPTNRKFEWQVDSKIDDIYKGIIQFRPSGIRVKQPTEFPTLVAMVQVPIIGKYRRYLLPSEAASLQSFPKDYDFSKESDLDAYKQLGNAVNVDVIYNVFKCFIDYLENQISKG